jgi:hypothetical protein
LGLGAIKRQTRQCVTIALKKIGGKKIKMPVVVFYSKEHYKEILFTDEKILQGRKLLISRTIEFIYGHQRKSVNWCQGLNEVIILPL